MSTHYQFDVETVNYFIMPHKTTVKNLIKGK